MKKVLNTATAGPRQKLEDEVVNTQYNGDEDFSSSRQGCHNCVTNEGH